MMSNSLLTEFLSGSRRALAKLISAVENDGAIARTMLDDLYAKVGNAYRIGITGPPGAGKSTLVDQLAKIIRATEKTIGIVAVDPTSPFTGGALLGDRVRMTDIATDPGIFIRSMATRGSLGGLSQKAQDAADVLDVFGKDFVIFETVGVGQSELDVVEAADTVIVILVPESGDSIQAMKAGLMEIADIFMLNKADRDGAQRALREIEAILHLRPAALWNPPLIAVVASVGKGIDEVWKKIQAHRDFLSQDGRLEAKRKQRLERKIRELASRRLKQEFWDEEAQRLLSKSIDNFQNQKLSPYRIVDELMEKFKVSLRQKMDT